MFYHKGQRLNLCPADYLHFLIMLKNIPRVNPKYIKVFASAVLVSFVLFTFLYFTNYGSEFLKLLDKANIQNDTPEAFPLSSTDKAVVGEVESIEDEVLQKVNPPQGLLGESFSDILNDLYKKYNPPEEEVTYDYSSNNNQTSNQNTDIEPQPEVQEEPDPPPPPPPPPSSCPVSTLGCVRCEREDIYCRYEEGEESGYLGWACQNNNPSNIRYSQGRIGYITQMGGTAPCGEKGGFMVFATYEIGYNSVKTYIRAIDAGLHPAYRVYNCGDCTLLEFFSKYAPNNPEGYSGRVAEIMGDGVDKNVTKLNWVVNNRLDDFVNAIQHIEGYWTKDGRL